MQLQHWVSPRCKHVSFVQNIAKIVADTIFIFTLLSGIAEALYHHESESLDWLVATVAAQLSTPATSVTINLKLCQCMGHFALGGNNQTKYLSLVHVKYFWYLYSLSSFNQFESISILRWAFSILVWTLWFSFNHSLDLNHSF